MGLVGGAQTFSLHNLQGMQIEASSSPKVMILFQVCGKTQILKY